MDYLYRSFIDWVCASANLDVLSGRLTPSLASVLFAISPADVIYWRMPFNAMWMAVLGADL
jgi:hypothetical protein